MEREWRISGFKELSKGTLGNAGQNVYVSANGVLQRIWLYDVNKDGYVDLPVANSHDYNEHPDLTIIHDPTGKAQEQHVLTQGAQTGAVGDLNGNGYDDLIIGTLHDGQHTDLASYVYFGGPGGITENRKIDLAAPACSCAGIGDFNGDGRKEIVYLIADSGDCSSPNNLFNTRLRVYRQHPEGFRMNAYRDYPAEITRFIVADIDRDGCDDLYCRTADGRWLILWGGTDGFSMDIAFEVGPPTDDAKRFDLLPFGGGNMRYVEEARPAVLTLNGRNYVFYADESSVHLIPFEGRKICKGEIILPVPDVIAAAAGNVTEKDDLVLVQVRSREDQHVLIFGSEDGWSSVKISLTAVTPRDALLHDFSGTGHDDLVIVQGRDTRSHTTTSLLYLSDECGNLSKTPRRFVTHNCVAAFAADFDGSGKQSLVFVNQQQSAAYGHIPVYIYLGSEEGYRPERRLEFPGHSAGTIMSIDFTDNGWPDVLVLHNAEDQPFLNPPADLYFGGPEGFDLSRKQEIYAPLAWGGHCADLDRDGYLDLVLCCGNKVCIEYGGPNGFSEERMTVLDPIKGEPEGSAASTLWPAIADLNGNGWLDIVIPISMQPFSRIYWGGPDGYSDERSSKLPVDYAITVRIADLTKNGYPDIIFGSRASLFRNVYHEGAVTIFWGGPEGYSGYNCCVLPCYEIGDLSIADYNNDGWLDIFASTYFNKRERDINSYIYWNDQGNFSLTNRKRFFTHSSSGCLAGDFNEDGWVDLFVTNHRMYGNHRTESAIWWNGSDGFKEENRTWLPTIGPHDLTPNDIGNIMDRGPEEFYITPPTFLPDLRAVGWDGEIPVKTWVNAQIRTAETEAELIDKPFVGLEGTENSRFGKDEAIPAKLIHGSWFQIKLYLGAINSGNTPRITEIYALSE